ncbi:hypothetical protein Tco_0489634 [Tanacetum coccineum]
MHAHGDRGDRYQLFDIHKIWSSCTSLDCSRATFESSRAVNTYQYFPLENDPCPQGKWFCTSDHVAPKVVTVRFEEKQTWVVDIDEHDEDQGKEDCVCTNRVFFLVIEGVAVSNRYMCVVGLVNFVRDLIIIKGSSVCGLDGVVEGGRLVNVIGCVIVETASSDGGLGTYRNKVGGRGNKAAARRFEASSSLAMVSAKATIDSLRRDGFDVGGGVYEG